jgi:hypothetical protein
LYLHIFRRERFNVALGRLQTKFVARAGVFAKSLDRNNGNGFNINWTDGIHGTLHLKDESILHLVSEYNDPDGPSSDRVPSGAIRWTSRTAAHGFHISSRGKRRTASGHSRSGHWTLLICRAPC